MLRTVAIRLPCLSQRISIQTSRFNSPFQLETLRRTELIHPSVSLWSIKVSSFRFFGSEMGGKTMRFLMDEIVQGKEYHLGQIEKLHELYEEQKLQFFEAILGLDEASRNVLFQSFIQHLPGGLLFVIDLRRDLLEILHNPATTNKQLLTNVNASLHSFLSNWFHPGSLVVERISMESPKIITSDEVHEIGSIEELKKRLVFGKRIYVLTQPDFPLPLSFINVALLNEIPTNMAQIVDNEEEIPNPTHCIFYSIVSVQKGLTGIDLGNLLIKRVVDLMQREFKSLTTFVTLSPLPNFMKWLHLTLKEQPSLIPKEIGDALSHSCPSPNEALKTTLASNWYYDATKASILQNPLMHLSARYLVLEKKGKYAMDPVCNFHIRNGANIEQLNWMADLSQKRVSQSGGIMVNYKYQLHQVEENRNRYLTDGTIPISDQISFWLKSRL